MAIIIPAALTKAGFVPVEQIRPQRKRLMVSIAGDAGSGKNTFGFTAPRPGACITLDRGIEQATKEQAPVPLDGWGFRLVPVPLAGQATKEDYLTYWVSIRDTMKTVAAIPDIYSILFDGDTDSWELQRLAAFGKLTKIPSILYDEVNAARRAFYARMFDSKKNFIATNRVERVYKTVYNPDGSPKLNNSGNEVREWNGQYERKGFGDNKFLWQVHLLALHEVRDGEHHYGVKIEMNKINPSVEGMELWGDECNFQTLAQYTYPDSRPEDWGYPKGLW